MIDRPPIASSSAHPPAPAGVRWRALALGVGLAAGGALLALAPVAAQPRPEIPACPDNLLFNPGMEEGFGVSGGLDRLVPIGWSPWYAALSGDGGADRPLRFGPRRLLGAADDRVADGLWSAEVATESATHVGGLWQRVVVEPGTIVQATIWAYGWASNGERGAASMPPGTYALAAGIDPLGGEDPDDERIRWTRAVTVTDAWLPLTLSVAAEGGAVTLFARGQALAVLAHNTATWDAACLRATGLVGEPPWPAPPRPRPTATPDPAAPLPTEDPLALALVDMRLHDGLAEAAATVGVSEMPALDPRATRMADAARAAARPPLGTADEAFEMPAGALLAEHAGWFTLALAAMVAGLLVGFGRGGAV